MTKILILGGGFAGIETYRRLHQKVHPAHKHDVQIELISQTNYFTFTPMLHEAATGAVSREHLVQPLRETLACCGQDFHEATVTKIDPEQQVVGTNHNTHAYDILVIALGVEQGWFGVPGAAEHAIPLKWLPDAVRIRNQIIRAFEMASEMHDKHDVAAMEKYLHFIIVGGGASGVELAGQVSDLITHEMRDFYGDIPNQLTKITLVHAGDRVLQQLSPWAAQQATKRLNKLGVKIMLNALATEVAVDGVKIKTNEFISGNNIFWTAGTQSSLTKILPESLLDEHGLVKITPARQAVDEPNIFAIGDCAVAVDPQYTYPPLAQAAVQAAEVVASNIVATINNKPLTMRRYRHIGTIIPIGNGFAVFEHRWMRWSGTFAWLLRRAVFLATMYGWTNRLQVSFDWLIAMFLPRDTSEL